MPAPTLSIKSLRLSPADKGNTSAFKSSNSPEEDSLGGQAIWMDAKFVRRAESTLFFTLVYFYLTIDLFLSKWRTFTGRLVTLQLRKVETENQCYFLFGS